MNQELHHNSKQEKLRQRVTELMGEYVSPQEYAERRDDFSDPHIEIISAGDVSIACFGANHQNDPEHEQMRQIQEMMDTQRPAVVMVEGMRILEDKTKVDDFCEHLRGMSYEDASKNGEAFMTTWYAVKCGIRAVCPEPSYKELFAELKKRSFDPRAIWLEKMLSMGIQWKTHNIETSDDPETQILSLNKYMYRPEWSELLELPTSLDVVSQCEGYARDLGIPLTRDNMFKDGFVFGLQDPIPWKGKTMYATNDVAQASSRYRDERIIERMLKEIEVGNKNLMIVYGCSHIHMLSPVIQTLVRESVPD